MAPMKVASPRALFLISQVAATITLSFGVNAFLRPDSAMSFFEISPSDYASNAHLIHSLMIIYGIRDIFMAASIYAAAWYGDRRILGCLMIAGSVVAGVDGAVCKWRIGKGEWGHWGYGPVLGGVGMVLLVGGR